MEAKFYIYKITNLINKKIYIGKTYNIKVRFNAHKAAARRSNKNDYSLIHRALNKYGFENFQIESLAEYSAEEDALQAEKEFIKKYNSMNRDAGYNLTEGCDGSSGFKFTEEQKRSLNQEKKLTYIGENNPFYGKNHSEESLKIISQKAIERNMSGENNPFYGKQHSEESLRKIIKNHYDKKKFFSEEEIQKLIYKKKVLKMTYIDIGKEYNVSWNTVADAVNSRRAYRKDK